jgi:hypothetical protein
MTKIATIYAVCALLSVSSARADDSKDFDLACAIATAAGMGVAREAGVDYKRPAFAYAFFIGRLSMRDSSVNWSAVVFQNVHQLYQEVTPQLSETMQTCIGLAEHAALAH